jgi:DNA-directed RNA polymerase specialized sigma24 family protein
MASLGRPALRAAVGLSQAPPLARSEHVGGLSDAEALRRLRRDPEAIVSLYDRHVARLVAALAAASGDRELAFDLRVDAEELRSVLGHALEALPAEQRVAVVGRVVLDRDYAGLADGSVDETAIRARVSRGLRALRIRLSGGRP